MTSEGRLRKVGGSVMLAIPRAMLEALDLASNSSVGLAVKSGRLVVEPRVRRRYSLDDLLAQCKPTARKDRDWVIGNHKGRELI